jgi:hypothetical protein
VTATAVTVTPDTPAGGTPAASPAPTSPVDAVLYGDSGTLVQSYGAVALLEAPLAFAPVYLQPLVPAVPPVAPVTRTARVDVAA